MTIEDIVKRVIIEQFGVNKEQVTPEASFEKDLGADDLDIVEIVTKLENQFDIDIPDEDMLRITTVGAAIEYLKEKFPNG